MLHDAGVPFIAGAVERKCFHREQTEPVLEGQAGDTPGTMEHALVEREYFSTLKRGDPVTVEGTEFVVEHVAVESLSLLRVFLAEPGAI